MTVAVIGWALVHSLWLGAAIAAAFAAVLIVTRNSAPAIRYWSGLVALAAMIALPVATAYRTVQPAMPAVSVIEAPAITETEAPAPAIDALTNSGSLDAEAGVVASAPQGQSLLRTVENAAEGLMPWMVVIWFVGLALSSLRLLGGLVRTRRMTRRGVAAASETLDARVWALASKLDLTRIVRVLESTREGAPLVIGALRPVIVLPASLVTGLTPIQLDMLLAHELAHIRRHDFLINLAQTIIDTLLFYHPAARWISNRVREERENCCDDIAIEVCGGNAKVYAETLLVLEEARPQEYTLAAAATGGSLIKRIRRVVLGQPAHIELGPLWIAGLVTIAAALLTGREAVALGIHSSLIPGYSLEMPADTGDKRDQRLDPSKAAPSTVLRAPAGGTLNDRWRWAEQRGASLGGSYWIGYVVQGDPDATHHYYASDVPVSISNGSMQMSGSMHFQSTDMSDMVFSGVRLAPLVGNHEPNSIVMLFQVSQGVTGRKITRTHVGSFSIPAYFYGRPLLWLDRAPDAESIERIQAVLAGATVEVQRNLVGAIGAHTSDRLVVPVLSSLAQSASSHEDVRESAVEALGRESGALSMPVITRVARNDRSTDVRRSAIESLGHLDNPAATDSLMAFIRNARTRDEKRTAVEALGHRDEQRAAKFLVDIAEANLDSEIQQQAVEALGSMPDDRGMAEVERIARSGTSSDTKRAAVESIGSWNDSNRALTLLNEIVRTERLEDVRVAAVEAISSVHDARSVENLRLIATSNESQAIRLAAIESLGNTVDDVKAVAVLRGFAEKHPDEDVRISAMETLADMKGVGSEYMESVIRGNEPDEFRQRALEIYADHADRKRALALLRSVVLNDRSEDMRLRALELLGDVDDRDKNAVREVARLSKSPTIRDRALEIIADR